MSNRPYYLLRWLVLPLPVIRDLAQQVSAVQVRYVTSMMTSGPSPKAMALQRSSWRPPAWSLAPFAGHGFSSFGGAFRAASSRALAGTSTVPREGIGPPFHPSGTGLVGAT